VLALELVQLLVWGKERGKNANARKKLY